MFRTQGRTITEADLVTFAVWSWDTNPVHTDAVSTVERRFGGPIAHGVLGLSVVMGLASREGVFDGCSVALLGIDGWRFHLPIRAGDTVRAEITITGTRLTSSGETGVLERRFELFGADDKLVQSGRIDLMVSCRPTA
ncbi:MaoC/PaaZ C-terminal domain-containing protein [Dietzia sp. NPDC055343]